VVGQDAQTLLEGDGDIGDAGLDEVAVEDGAPVGGVGVDGVVVSAGGLD